MLQCLQQLRCRRRGSMRATRSVVISMRLPVESGKRLKRMANRHGWTPSDASARLVEEGLRRSEFAFIDFRDSPVGRQAYINYAKAFPEEIEGALSENAATDFEALKRMLPQAVELSSGGAARD